MAVPMSCMRVTAAAAAGGGGGGKREGSTRRECTNEEVQRRKQRYAGRQREGGARELGTVRSGARRGKCWNRRRGGEWMVDVWENRCEGRRQCLCRSRGGSRNEPELAVLRFSIGFPELEENLKLPRLIGVAAAVLIVLNLNSPLVESLLSPSSPAQTTPSLSLSDGSLRSSFIGLLLASLCAALPNLDDYLNGNSSSQKSKTTKSLKMIIDDEFISTVADSDMETSKDIRKELAWGSYVLLRNTLISAFIVVYKKEDGDVKNSREEDDTPESCIVFFRGEANTIPTDNSSRESMRSTVIDYIKSGVKSTKSFGIHKLDETIFPGVEDSRVFEWSSTELGISGIINGKIYALLLSNEGVLENRELEWSKTIIRKMISVMSSSHDVLN